MTITDATPPVVRPEPKRDRWGRYVIPHPDTGKEVGWTRATTWAKTCSDTFGLTKWELRMAALGLAKRPDLVAQAATVIDADDKDAKRLLDRLAADAKEAAGASTRANLGTALHSMTELIDAGTAYEAPELYRADLDAYKTATAHLGIDPNHIERIVTVPELLVAGTFDRLVTHEGRLYVADLKTGRDLSYSWGEIAIQLALYAHAQTMWNAETGQHEPMPTVDQNLALVFHLPVGEGVCTIHTVDIAAGWEMAQTCGTVRAWRKRKGLATLLDTVTADLEASLADAPETADRTQWIVDRITALKTDNPERVALASERWPADAPKKPPWTDQQIDSISAVLHAVEHSFPATDPVTHAGNPPAPQAELEPAALPDVTDDGTMATDEDVAGLKATIRGLAGDEPRISMLTWWAKQGKTAGRQWDSAANGMTVRCWNIARAAIRTLTCVGPHDQRMRSALAYVLVSDIGDHLPTGAVLGSLTTRQAIELADLADTYRAGDPTVRTVIDGDAPTTA